MTYDDDAERPAERGQASSPPKSAEIEERVGYKCPPKRTRFVSGQSGNPEGRPKGSLNRSTIRAMVHQVWFEETIKIIEGGRERNVPRFLALLRKQVDLAIKGDAKAISDSINFVYSAAVEQPAPRVAEETAAEDEAILRTHATDLLDGEETRPGSSSDDSGEDGE